MKPIAFTGSLFSTNFSQVTCSYITYTQVIAIRPSSGTSTVVLPARGDLLTESESTNTPRETYSQSNVQTPVPSSNSGRNIISFLVTDIGMHYIYS